MTVNTVTVGPGVLTLGNKSDLFVMSSQVTKCTVKPQVKKGDPIAVLSGEKAQGDRTEAFTLSGTFLQDLGADKSVTEFTWANAGKDLPFEYIPNNAGQKAIRGIVTVEATDIGGEIGGKATADFEWECTTKPTIEPAITGPGA